MEYKVNDIVTCLPGFTKAESSGGFEYLEGRTIKISKINGEILRLKNGNGVFTKAVRKATIPEIEQYVKDKNCSIEEILEICKNLYSEVDEVFPINNDGTVFNVRLKLKGAIEIYEPNQKPQIVAKNTERYLYSEGKFAQIAPQQEELPFKVGDKAQVIKESSPYSEGHIGTVYEVDKSDNTVRLTPKTSGNWISMHKLKLCNSSFKKEDFYNTKIDVSESPELSRLVQEKLFELGFTWASSSKSYYETRIVYITEDYSGTLYSSSDRQYKQIYPQDLGININQTIKNNNNVNNKENTSKQNYSGRSIEVRRPTPTISTGQRRSGSSIQGKKSKTRFTSGHLSHRTISC